MRALLCVLILTTASCDAWRMHPERDDGACSARWQLGELEVRDALTETWDDAMVDATPLWMGDLDGDGRRDVVLAYRGSRTHEAVVLRSCGGDRYQVLLDEVRASSVGTTRAPDGWLDLELIDGSHKSEYKHGPNGYDAASQDLGRDLDWQ